MTVPASSYYKIETWGAQGGYRTDSSYTGKGGYATGTVFLEIGTSLHIYVGGSGNNGGYNGGGTAGIATTESYYGSGCGANACGQGGTQSSGGAGTSTSGYTATAGSFGSGGKGYAIGGGFGGAGGGGWYGGSGSTPDSSGDDDRGGGGGSGYVLTSSSYKPAGYALGAAYYMTNTQLIDGNSVMPTGTGGTMTGNTGEGYVIITQLSIK